MVEILLDSYSPRETSNDLGLTPMPATGSGLKVSLEAELRYSRRCSRQKELLGRHLEIVKTFLSNPAMSNSGIADEKGRRGGRR
jgi:hypothetical protein